MDEVLRQVGPVGLVVLTIALPVVLARVIPMLLRRPARWAGAWLQQRMAAPEELNPVAPGVGPADPTGSPVREPRPGRTR